MHSRITFYGYAKIGQVNGGGRPPPRLPLDPPLAVFNNGSMQLLVYIAARSSTRIYGIEYNGCNITMQHRMENQNAKNNGKSEAAASKDWYTQVLTSQECHHALVPFNFLLFL